jgi:hypothetical protein
LGSTQRCIGGYEPPIELICHGEVPGTSSDTRICIYIRQFKKLHLADEIRRTIKKNPHNKEVEKWLRKASPSSPEPPRG